MRIKQTISWAVLENPKNKSEIFKNAGIFETNWKDCKQNYYDQNLRVIGSHHGDHLAIGVKN